MGIVEVRWRLDRAKEWRAATSTKFDAHGGSLGVHNGATDDSNIDSDIESHEGIFIPL